jgi:hypothetical protein
MSVKARVTLGPFPVDGFMDEINDSEAQQRAQGKSGATVHHKTIF